MRSITSTNPRAVQGGLGRRPILKNRPRTPEKLLYYSKSFRRGRGTIFSKRVRYNPRAFERFSRHSDSERGGGSSSGACFCFSVNAPVGQDEIQTPQPKQ
jgi:hypothetical protein